MKKVKKVTLEYNRFWTFANEAILRRQNQNYKLRFLKAEYLSLLQISSFCCFSVLCFTTLSLLLYSVKFYNYSSVSSARTILRYHFTVAIMLAAFFLFCRMDIFLWLSFRQTIFWKNFLLVLLLDYAFTVLITDKTKISEILGKNVI